MRVMLSRLFACVALSLASTANAVVFDVTLDAKMATAPQTGRLVVYLVGPDVDLGRSEPARWDAWFDKMPLVGTSVRDLAPGASATLDDTCDSFLTAPSKLAPGKWSAQAVLDVKQDTSSFFSETGNFWSEPVTFTVDSTGDAKPIKLSLTRVTKGSEFTDRQGVEFVNVKSKLLSDFRGREVTLHAGVVKPVDFDAKKTYAAIYDVPGFGGRATSALRQAAKRQAGVGSSDDERTLARSTFYVVLDPEGPNGHTLFADSRVNGPCGRALVEELIPAIEAKYPQLAAKPAGRIVTGHSSGGWSSLWLGLTYPETFGAVWSSSPDPIDFRKLELIDIYADANAYEKDGKEVSSTRDLKMKRGGEVLSVREENGQEYILGPGNSSAGQWDSWQAVWGTPRDGDKLRPKPLFDEKTGAIDREEAERYRQYDVGHLLRTDPAKYLPLWRTRVRLVVGADDNFYLNEAVQLVKADLEKMPDVPLAEPRDGYIKIVPGTDHGTVFGSAEMRGRTKEMIEFLRRGGFVGEK
jgi:pimeloyl-ACP methyl ester carboxylesterase